MTYQPTQLVTYNATLFLETALKNEDQTPNWLLAALKTPENGVVIDNILLISQHADWVEVEEDEPPSYSRRDYDHILPKKKETATTCIAPTGQMLMHLIDSSRRFRIDFKFFPVYHFTPEGSRLIDVLDVEIINSNLTQLDEEMIVEWFNDRIEELRFIHTASRERAPHLKLVVINE